nr:YihY/virulence factor BrkB family protein [uncultured Friedmanniella sp.]
MDSQHGTGTDPSARPAPDAPGKPTSLRQISRRSWSYLLRRTIREFMRDDCYGLAAGLTYHAVLAVFPGLIALVSLLGVLGQGPESARTILEIVRRLVPGEAVDILQPVIERLASSSSAVLALVLGLLGALWFVSGYILAFGRAMNRIYQVEEGRPLPRLYGQTALVTLLLGLMALCAVLLLLISGPVARAVGEVLDLGSTVLLVWGIAKWPALALILAVVIAVLYYTAPNVQQPRFRWLSPGALLAILVWLGGTALFGLYVGSFSRYDATYGSLAGGIVFLVWLWVTNLALLLGAVLDAEIERARELQAGIQAEHQVQLPPRDTRSSDRASARHDRDVQTARQIREQARPRP